MNFHRYSAFALAGLAVTPVVLCLPARAQDGEDLASVAVKADAARKAEKWEEAVALYSRAIELAGPNAKMLYGPKIGNLYFLRGVALMKMARWAEAIKDFQKCYQDFPNAGDAKAGGGNRYHKQALLRWGEAAMGAEDWKEAIIMFERFLKERRDDDPNDRYAKGVMEINLARCQYRLGKIPEGNKHLETAIANKYNEAFQVPPLGILVAFQDLVQAVIERRNEQALIDFINKNRSSITLEPFEMGDYTKLFMKLAADAVAVDMERAAMMLYQLTPTTPAAIQDTKVRLDALSVRPGVKDGIRTLRTKPLKEYYDNLTSSVRANKVPEITKLAAAAFIHETEGNTRGAFAAYEQLELHYPKSDKREDYLYNLVRTSSLVGEVLKTETYGQAFLKAFPDSKYVPEVRRMLLSSLFYEGEYETCIEVASAMIDSLQKPSEQHDICLHVLGGSYFYTAQFDKAQPLLDDHVKTYPKSQFELPAFYFHASNLTRLQEWTRAAPLLDEFFKRYPDPQKNMFYPFALFDRANCHYAQDEYEPALEKLNRIADEFPTSEVMDMAYNLRGNVLVSLDRFEEAEKSYLAGMKLAENRQNDVVVAESLYFLVALLGKESKDPKEPNPRLKDAIPYADLFWKKYADVSTYKPQMAVAQIAAFTEAGRGPEALERLQTVIAEIAKSEYKYGLEETINSHTEAFLKLNEKDSDKEDKLKALYYNFPNIEASNEEARAILRMAVVGVYEKLIKENAKDEDLVRKATAMIKVLFDELKRDFDPKKLTNFILVRVGDNIRRSGSYQEALPFYDEAIGRPDQSFRFAALIGRGDVTSRSSDPAAIDKAVADFDRVLADSQKRDERETAAHLKVRALMNKNNRAGWEQAAEAAKFYLDRQQNPSFNKNAAEVGYLLAKSYDQRGEANDAIAMYAKVWGGNIGNVPISAPAMKRYMELLWDRNQQGRRDPQTGQNIPSDRQGAYDAGAKYIEATTQAGFLKKMTDEETVLWREVEALVNRYVTDPAIKSLKEQRQEAEARARSRRGR